MNLTQNLRASTFNKDLSIDTTFSQIHLNGQYLFEVRIVQTFDEGSTRNDKQECQAFLLINFKEILVDEIYPRWM